MTPLSHLIYQDTINKYEITKFKFISLICNVSNQMENKGKVETTIIIVREICFNNNEAREK